MRIAVRIQYHFHRHPLTEVRDDSLTLPTVQRLMIVESAPKNLLVAFGRDGLHLASSCLRSLFHEAVVTLLGLSPPLFHELSRPRFLLLKPQLVGLHLLVGGWQQNPSYPVNLHFIFMTLLSGCSLGA